MVNLAAPLVKRLSKNETNYKWQGFITYLLVAIFGFFIGRAVVFEFLNPFSVAFLCAALINRSHITMASAGLLFGAVSCRNSEMLLWQIAIVVNLLILYAVFKNIKAKKILFIILGMIVSFTAGFFIFYAKNYYLYDLLMLIMQSVMVCALINIIEIGFPLLTGFKHRMLLSKEEIASLIILLASLFLGPTIKFWGLSLNKTLSIFLILLISYGGDIGIGAIAGTSIGVLQSLSGDIFSSAIGIYSLCGLVASALKRFGRLSMVMGFVFTNAFMTFYINGSTEVLISKNEIVLASVTFLLIPKKILDAIFRFASVNCIQNNNDVDLKTKNYVRERLADISEVFKELASSLNAGQNNNNYFSQMDAAHIIEKTAKDVCYTCGMYDSCWKTDFYRTYERMFGLLSSVESGKIQKFDEKTPIVEKCIFPLKLWESLRLNFNLYKSNQLWRKKLDEGRALYSRQMSETSKLIEGIANALSTKMEFNKDIERQIAAALDKLGIHVQNVSVIKKKNSMEIDIKHKPCSDKRVCTEKILPVIKEVTGKTFAKTDLSCRVTGKNVCYSKFREALKYSVYTGFTRKQKQSSLVSGDNFSFIETEDGKFFMILSDGMGSGHRAAVESNIAVSLLEKFLYAGYEQNTSIEAINSLLLVKSDEDSYATLDISSVNQYTGEIEFTKVGAVSTFIKRDDRVEIIKNSSLPAGILNNVDIGFNKKRLKEGDFVIMVTDGALEANRKEVDKENWLADLIDELKVRNPQKLAECVLEKCLAESEGIAMDDITVLVAKLWRSDN
ncbi:MAG: stage II sporulation protein E [Clostridiales bacterium]|nr:stage II sporulation protein E [Clostridiales bacterium]